MKNVTLTILFSIICCVGFTQPKKPGSIKKTNPDTVSNSLLRQEKIWPVSYKNSKSKTGSKSAASFETGNRL